MKIVITGASGFVGRHLVPRLTHHAKLLLVGRDMSRLARLFPNEECCTYANLACLGRGADLIVHLAVVNNNQDAPAQVFQDVNVGLLIETAQAARAAGIARLINVSSVHALNDRDRSAYAETKRAGMQALAGIEGLSATTIFLAAVYSDEWSGSLAFLNRLPRPISKVIFPVLASLRPTVHIDHLVRYLLQEPRPNSPDVLSDTQEKNWFYRLSTRLLDLSAGVVLLVLFSWLMAIIWVLIRLQSPGPGIFAQKRVGQHGRIFTCYKFRTMFLGTPESATNLVAPTQVTSLGSFLRKTKLDELPQLWNVIWNEMSLIGPRPCLPVQTELIEARRRRGVLRLKPGISGLAQIKGIDMSDPERLARWDQRYGALQSLLLDLSIGIATIGGRGQGDRVIADTPYPN